MHCANCNDTLNLSSGDRIGFRDSCDGCGHDLHTCENCSLYDLSAYNECRESSADRVLDKDRANRCEYFSPGDQTGGAGAKSSSTARSDLENLFKKD
jgi:hypothetical protein